MHPPQVALVGFGAVVERPWAASGMLGVRPVVIKESITRIMPDADFGLVRPDDKFRDVQCA
uniref:hypothetical protein n=1 Tax=Streptomyces corallincola TaxID=2851888 RepID=UPI001FE3718D|nr:hypothetical protein [Streptomyces corallincola]